MVPSPAGTSLSDERTVKAADARLGHLVPPPFPARRGSALPDRQQGNTFGARAAAK